MPLVDVIRSEIPELHDAMVRGGTAESIQTFCSQAHSLLSLKLGLEKYDRTAVIWAYLKDSNWARRGSARPADPGDDECISALADGIAKLPQLPIPANVQAESGNERVRVWEASKAYREGANPKQGGLIPTAILNKSVTGTWVGMFAERVTLTSVRKSVSFGAIKSLEPGDSINRSAAEAGVLMESADLTWISSKPGERPCFFKADDQTTRRIFTASGACMQIRRPFGTEDMPTEFMVEEDLTTNAPPKIIEVRFFSG